MAKTKYVCIKCGWWTTSNEVFCKECGTQLIKSDNKTANIVTDIEDPNLEKLSNNRSLERESEISSILKLLIIAAFTFMIIYPAIIISAFNLTQLDLWSVIIILVPEIAVLLVLVGFLLPYFVGAYD